MRPYQVISIPGPTRFREVHEQMRGLLERRIRDEIPDTLLMVEHAPVITRGRGLQWREDRSERAKPLLLVPEGTDYEEIERGGDLTWHGPGQLVVYPIVKLGGEGMLGKAMGQDVDRYIRFLENLWIDVLKPFGIEATSRVGGSGVWIGDRKAASVGIAIRRWVTYHGVAMNIVNSLGPFRAFSPCGFEPEVMTRLQDQAAIPMEWLKDDWRDRWERVFLERLDAQLLSLL
jgi:lipoyl(octanoyl) transferase